MLAVASGLPPGLRKIRVRRRPPNPYAYLHHRLVGFEGPARKLTPVPICPSCGEDNPERARFCLACGSLVEAVPTPAAEERKVVSVLFVDLVGFTASSDRADPEDVRARLRPYHSMLKQEIERYGGNVEKFIGDAVMAVFGAPVAHEDDAERAVRSALRITEMIPELNKEHPGFELSVRAAVNTGEAVVSLGARPEQGEGIATGDVVNTASRLQGVAPVGGVAVGEVTYRATRDLIEYEPLDPVTVKGKQEPIPVWRALAARSRFGVDVERPKTPFVGREDDLALLQQTYARMLRESSVQLLTITGEPGVGKTRLVAEFQGYVDDRPEIVSWRQGRCLPYGEGITFWALGEIVKSHAGILESDGPEDAASKLAGAVDVVEENDREWVRSRLAPLVGIGADREGAAGQQESFAAWRAFLESIAANRPLVLVIEDLHWADDAMLGFVEHLADWSSGVPMLLLCTARPELYERRAGWGGGKRNSATIGLSPLSSEDTVRLIAELLGSSVLPADVQAALLERAGGNPLYAEEFARMLVDRGILRRHGQAWSLGEAALIELPETVQALIAARLDTLPADRKALLQDAAVIGKVFWSGAVAAMGGRDEATVAEGLHELTRKELVRPARRSSVEGQHEFAFWHLLIRDVAYGQIPRATRAAKHRAAAEWIEDLAGERVADHADVLAYHYGEALELARAAGAEDIELLEERCRTFLLAAADRALQLDLAKANQQYRRALELTPVGHPDRARVLVALGRSLRSADRAHEAMAVLREAVDILKETGDRRALGDALVMFSFAIRLQGDTARSMELLQEAVGLLEQEPPGPELAGAYGRVSAHFMMSGRYQECLEWADRTIESGSRLGLDEVVLHAYQDRGIARCSLGDPAGMDDLRFALARGLELGHGWGTSLAYINLADFQWMTEGPAKGLATHREGIEFSKRRGASTLWATGETTWMLYDLGEWDELLRVTDEVAAWDRERGGSQIELLALPFKVRVLAHRGKVSEASSLVDDMLVRAREAGDPQVLLPALIGAELTAEAEGDGRRVRDLIEEHLRVSEGSVGRPDPDAMRILLRERGIEALEAAVQGLDSWMARIRHELATVVAMAAEARGDLDEAARRFDDATAAWSGFEVPLEHGHALFGAGRCLVHLGRTQEATERLRVARELFSGLGAQPLVNEADDWLQRATALSS